MDALWSTAGLAPSSSGSSSAARSGGGRFQGYCLWLATGQFADAGSIEEYGIELPVILAGHRGSDRVELLRLPLGKGLIRTVPHGFAPVVRR